MNHNQIIESAIDVSQAKVQCNSILSSSLYCKKKQQHFSNKTFATKSNWMPKTARKGGNLNKNVQCLFLGRIHFTWSFWSNIITFIRWRFMKVFHTWIERLKDFLDWDHNHQLEIQIKLSMAFIVFKSIFRKFMNWKSVEKSWRFLWIGRVQLIQPDVPRVLLFNYYFIYYIQQSTYYLLIQKWFTYH